MVVQAIFDWLRRWAEVISGLGSLLLTFALVYLYLQQKNILSRTFRANQRAIIDVDSSYPSNDDLALTLSNVGNGVALDPELVIVGIYTDDAGEVSHGLVKNRLNRLDRGDPTTPGSLPARKHETQYSGRVTLPSVHGGPPTEFSLVIDQLKGDIAVARIHTWVRYTDPAEEYHVKYVAGWEFDPAFKGFDFDPDVGEANASEYLNKASQMLYGEPELNPETLEYDLTQAETGNERTVM